VAIVVTESIAVHAPPEAVWSIIRDPASIGEWLPILAGAIYEAGERICWTRDGDEIRERILDSSDEERWMAYEIATSPFPLLSNHSRIAVHGHGDHSHVVWTTELEAIEPGQEDELAETFGALYREGLASLVDAVERVVAG
jgi:hypothetical protein